MEKTEEQEIVARMTTSELYTAMLNNIGEMSQTVEGRAQLAQYGDHLPVMIAKAKISARDALKRELDK